MREHPRKITLVIDAIANDAANRCAWEAKVLGDRLLGYLQIAASLEDVEAPLQQVRLFLAIGVPVTLGAIALTGWLLGGAAMPDPPCLSTVTAICRRC